MPRKCRLREAIAGGAFAFGRRVVGTSCEGGDDLGYDIASFDEMDELRFVEVKTMHGGPRTPFFVSAQTNSRQRPNYARDIGSTGSANSEPPRVFVLSAPLADAVHLEALQSGSTLQVNGLNRAIISKALSIFTFTGQKVLRFGVFISI